MRIRIAGLLVSTCVLACGLAPLHAQGRRTSLDDLLLIKRYTDLAAEAVDQTNQSVDQILEGMSRVPPTYTRLGDQAVSRIEALASDLRSFPGSPEYLPLAIPQIPAVPTQRRATIGALVAQAGERRLEFDEYAVVVAQLKMLRGSIEAESRQIPGRIAAAEHAIEVFRRVSFFAMEAGWDALQSLQAYKLDLEALGVHLGSAMTEVDAVRGAYERRVENARNDFRADLNRVLTILEQEARVAAEDAERTRTEYENWNGLRDASQRQRDEAAARKRRLVAEIQDLQSRIAEVWSELDELERRMERQRRFTDQAKSEYDSLVALLNGPYPYCPVSPQHSWWHCGVAGVEEQRRPKIRNMEDAQRRMNDANSELTRLRRRFGEAENELRLAERRLPVAEDELRTAERQFAEHDAAYDKFNTELLKLC